MSAPCIHLPEAKADIQQAYDYYEGKQYGLGERFLDHLRLCVAAICDNPEMYAILRNPIRAAPLRRFPYVAYYRLEAGTVFIQAVLHGHRDPSVWMSRN